MRHFRVTINKYRVSSRCAGLPHRDVGRADVRACPLFQSLSDFPNP
jgi:hypothetical protein